MAAFRAVVCKSLANFQIGNSSKGPRPPIGRGEWKRPNPPKLLNYPTGTSNFHHRVLSVFLERVSAFKPLKPKWALWDLRRGWKEFGRQPKSGSRFKRLMVPAAPTRSFSNNFCSGRWNKKAGPRLWKTRSSLGRSPTLADQFWRPKCFCQAF